MIGAGLAGLSAAWRLARAGRHVSVLERGDRPGGRLAGERVEGIPLSPAPLLLHGGDTRLSALIAELGARDELLPVRPAVSAFAASAGGLRDVELRGLRDVAKIPGLSRWHALRLLRLPRLLARYGRALELGAAESARSLDDRSLADFSRLYFGERVLDRWLAPLACAGSLGNPEQMSRVQGLQQLRSWDFSRAGVLRGSLDEVFERASRELEVVTQCGVERLEPGPAGSFRAISDDGRSFAGDAVVVATPAPLAARLTEVFLSAPERHFLGDVRYAPSLGVAAALCRPVAPRPRHVLVSPSHGSPLACAVVEPGYRGGSAPPGRGLALLRASGAFAEAHLDTPSESLEKELLASFDELWPGVARSVDFARVYRRRFGAPRFEVGSYRALARFRRLAAQRRRRGSRLVFAGDYLVAPSPEGAVRSGERAAAALLETGRAQRPVASS